MTGFILFIGILMIVLVVGHVFLFFSLTRFFMIVSRRWRMGLGIVLSIGAVSFFPASYIAHVYENAFTGALYMISGLWLGVGWHVLMGCIVVWGMIGAGSVLRAQWNRKMIAASVLVCFSLWAAYGVWGAFHPVMTHVRVSIDGLPTAWKGKRIVHLSDVHLGHVYGVDFLSRIIMLSQAQDPDLIVISGDLFDGMDSQLDHLVQPLRDLRAKDGVYVVTGNHETYTGVDKVYAALAQTPVTILDDVMTTVDGVQIVGVSYPLQGEKKSVADTITDMDGYEKHVPSILLYHNPAEVAAAREVGIDLHLAGHTHSGQVFPFQLITRMIYGPYYHGLTREDTFSIITSNGVGTWGPAMRTSGRPEIVVIDFP